MKRIQKITAEGLNPRINARVINALIDAHSLHEDEINMILKQQEAQEKRLDEHIGVGFRKPLFPKHKPLPTGNEELRDKIGVIIWEEADVSCEKADKIADKIMELLK